MSDFILQQKVRFQHCDPAGIVFYPRYFEMISETVEEWFAQRLGVPFAALHGERGAAVPTASLKIDFYSPSRLGDALEFRLRPTQIGRSSVALSIEARCGGERRLSMESTLVFTDGGGGKPSAWPGDIRGRISREIDGAVPDNA